MVGGGSVYLHARSIGFAEKYWINDQFEELIDFWKVVQDPETCSRLQKDLEVLRAGFSSPEETQKFFHAAREESPEDEYQVALLFFFFNRVTFSGTTRAGGFSKAASVSRFTASSIQRLKDLPAALAGTRITNWDFERVIACPGERVFIFLDPPYYTASRLYGRNGALHQFDHLRLAEVLRSNAHHKFLITYDDCPAVRELYSWANIQSWELQYGMNNCSKEKLSKIGSELFISNY
jgi:DNA adenine methylase